MQNFGGPGITLEWRDMFWYPNPYPNRDQMRLAYAFWERDNLHNCMIIRNAARDGPTFVDRVNMWHGMWHGASDLHLNFQVANHIAPGTRIVGGYNNYGG